MKKLANISQFESLMHVSNNSVFNAGGGTAIPATERIQDIYSKKKEYAEILPIILKGIEDGSIDTDGITDYEFRNRGDAASMLKRIKEDYDYSVEASKDPNIPESEYSVPKHYANIAKHYGDILEDLAHGYYAPTENLDEWDCWEGLGDSYDWFDEAKAGSPEAFLQAYRSCMGDINHTEKWIHKIEDEIKEDKNGYYTAEDLALWKLRRKRLEDRLNKLIATKGFKAYIASGNKIPESDPVADGPFKVYDKVAWHIDGGEDPEGTVNSLASLFDTLHSKGMLSEEGEELYQSGIDSSSSLHSRLVTPEGREFLDKHYAR